MEGSEPLGVWRGASRLIRVGVTPGRNVFVVTMGYISGNWATNVKMSSSTVEELTETHINSTAINAEFSAAKTARSLAVGHDIIRFGEGVAAATRQSFTCPLLWNLAPLSGLSAHSASHNELGRF